MSGRGGTRAPSYIEQAVLGGFELGSGARPTLVAAIWPERAGRSSLRGYLIGSQEAASGRCSRRRATVVVISNTRQPSAVGPATTSTRRDFARTHLADSESPKWNFDDATFDRSAESFDNPDHVAIVITTNRWPVGAGWKASEYDELEKTNRRRSADHRARHTRRG